MCKLIVGKRLTSGPDKTGLITHVSRFDFSPLTQRYIQISLPKSARLEWPAFAGCFFQAQWRSMQVVWGPNGALASLGLAVCSCMWLYSTVVLNKDLHCKCAFILAGFET